VAWLRHDFAQSDGGRGIGEKAAKIVGRGWHRRAASLRARKSPPFTPCAGWVVCMTDGPTGLPPQKTLHDSVAVLT